MKFEKTVEDLMMVRGTLACAVVDYESGILLDGNSLAEFDLDVLSAGDTEIIRSEIKATQLMHQEDGRQDSIEDMLITLEMQYYLLRSMVGAPGLFLFSVLDKAKSNLALARRTLREADLHFAA